MKKIRFYLSLWAAKLAILALKLLKRNGTHYPGVIAGKLCPDFLAMLQKPATIVGVTGTNGKTTVANLITDILTDNGHKVLSNRMGGNILGGITTVLIRGVNLFGRCRYPIAVLEMDERSSRLVLPHVQPDYLVCTNLFRDSYKRNAHSEYIQNILKNGIPEKTKLILNADDLIACGIRRDNACRYFGVAPLEGERQITDNIIKDVVVCPHCDHPITYDYCRYNHCGRLHCDYCGLTSPEPDVCAVRADTRAGNLVIAIDGLEHIFPLPGNNITDIYNTTAAVALLHELGLKTEAVADSLTRCGIVKTRYNAEEVNGKQVIMNLAKGQNPIACSRVFDHIRNQSGQKAVLILIDDYYDAAHSSESIGWLYEADFEFLRQADIQQIVIGGKRCQDYRVRLLLAGIPAVSIATCPDEVRAADLLDFESMDKIFILYDVYTIHLAQAAKKRLLGRMKGENDNEN